MKDSSLDLKEDHYVANDRTDQEWTAVLLRCQRPNAPNDEDWSLSKDPRNMKDIPPNFAAM